MDLRSVGLATARVPPARTPAGGRTAAPLDAVTKPAGQRFPAIRRQVGKAMRRSPTHPEQIEALQRANGHPFWAECSFEHVSAYAQRCATCGAVRYVKPWEAQAADTSASSPAHPQPSRESPERGRPDSRRRRATS